MYAITAKGRRALAAWLKQPGAGPVLEFEQLMHVFFSDRGTKGDVLATLAEAQGWARHQAAEAAFVGRQYLDGTGPFPERSAQLNACPLAAGNRCAGGQGF